MIASPSDPKVKRDNQTDHTQGKLDGGKWGASIVKNQAKANGNGLYYVHQQAGSYGHHLMGDDQTPETLLHFTRNVTGENASTAKMPRGNMKGLWSSVAKNLNINNGSKSGFNGPTTGSSSSRISGLDAGTGNWSTSGGAVVQGDNAQWNKAKDTTSKQRGGNLSEPNKQISRFFY